MANGYPDNQDCWNCSNAIKPVDGAIVVFAYAAKYKHTPCQDPDLTAFNGFMKQGYSVASGVGIDPVYIWGYIQQAGDFPTLAPLDAYLNKIGVRDPATGKLQNVTPGPTMYRPGPGDGYVGNGAATDPGLGHNPFAAAVGQVVGAALGGTAGTQAATAASHLSSNPASFLNQHPYLALGGIGLGALWLLRGR